MYDIRDYQVFHDIGLSCRDMSENEVDDALYFLKTQVLKGDRYRKEDLEEATYEFRRFFTQRYLKTEELLIAKEAEIEKVRRRHE